MDRVDASRVEWIFVKLNIYNHYNVIRLIMAIQSNLSTLCKLYRWNNAIHVHSIGMERKRTIRVCVCVCVSVRFIEKPNID